LRAKEDEPMDLYGPMRDVARKYLKAIPHTKGVPTQGEVDDLTRTLEDVRTTAARTERERIRAIVRAALIMGESGTILDKIDAQ